MVSNLVICSHPVAVIYCCINNQPEPSICACGIHRPGNLEGLAGLWGPRRAGHRECRRCKLLCVASQHCNLGQSGFLCGVLRACPLMMEEGQGVCSLYTRGSFCVSLCQKEWVQTTEAPELRGRSQGQGPCTSSCH